MPDARLLALFTGHTSACGCGVPGYYKIGILRTPPPQRSPQATHGANRSLPQHRPQPPSTQAADAKAGRPQDADLPVTGYTVAPGGGVPGVAEAYNNDVRQDIGLPAVSCYTMTRP